MLRPMLRMLGPVALVLVAAPAAAQPRFAAELVGSGFGMPVVLAPGTETTGYLEFRNAGTETWTPGTTNLGTTQPRDVLSPIAGTGWIGANRPATIDRSVPPGATGRFQFTVRAPAMIGTYSQTFNLVQELVAWFSDDGGPPDDAISVTVMVMEMLPDVDGDGDGALSSMDCNDADPTRHPAATEICADGIDQDCDGIDLACNGTDAGTPASDGGARPPAESGGCSATPHPPLAWIWIVLVGLAYRRPERT
jgi:hypothetical protein